MTSTRKLDPAGALDELPPALSSMWRLCKLGYRHEPGLMLAAFVLSLLAALPDALLALWFKLLGEGVAAGQRRAGAHRRCRARRVGGGHLVSAHGQHARAAPLPRQGHDRARSARRAAPGLGGHHRPPRASRLPGSPGHAAQPGVRPRSHVHVGVFDLRMDSASRRDRWRC